MDKGKSVTIPCSVFFSESLMAKVDIDKNIYLKWFKRGVCTEIIKPDRDDVIKLRDFLNEYLGQD